MKCSPGGGRRISRLGRGTGVTALRAEGAYSRPDGRGRFSHDDDWCNAPPHIVGRNSAAPFPAKAENSAQAPFLHLRPKSRPSGGWPPKRACGRSPLPTGPASLGSGGGLSFSERRKRENPPEGPLAASRLTLAGRARSTAQPLAALPLRAAASPSRGKEKKTFWSLRECAPFIGAAEGI